LNRCRSVLEFQGLAARSQLLTVITKAARQQSDDNKPCLLLAAIVDAAESSTDGSNTADWKTSAPSESMELVGSLVLEMMFGAIDPTLSAICTAIVRLCDQNHVIRRVREELTSVTGNCDPSDDFLSYDVVRSLSYVGDVVAEVLRVQPPVAGAFRKTIASFELGVSGLRYSRCFAKSTLGIVVILGTNIA